MHIKLTITPDDGEKIDMPCRYLVREATNIFSTIPTLTITRAPDGSMTLDANGSAGDVESSEMDF